VLDHDHGRAQLLADAQDQGAEGLGLPLSDASGRLVEEQELRVRGHQAAQLDDASRAGGQVGHELLGVVAEADEVDEREGLAPLLALGPG